MYRTGELPPWTGIMLLLLLLILLGAGTLSAGCGGRTADEITLDAGSCISALLEEVPFQDDLTALSDRMITTIYRIPAEDVVQQQVYVSSGATAEEIAFFEAAATEGVQRVEAAVRQHLADQKVGFEDYLPAELSKLADPCLLVRGKYVILCISDYPEKATKVLDALFE